MKVKELIAELLKADQESEVAVDIDDGVKGNYKDVTGIRMVVPIIGTPFIAIDSRLSEVPRHFGPVA